MLTDNRSIRELLLAVNMGVGFGLRTSGFRLQASGLKLDADTWALFQRSQMVARNAAANNVITTLTNSQRGGGNTVTCRPRPHAMARSHWDASQSCALAALASCLRDVSLNTSATTPSQSTKELSCMTNLKSGARSPESGALSPQPSAYSVLSARIGSSAAARRAGSRAAAIATMARTMAAEA